MLMSHAWREETSPSEFSADVSSSSNFNFQLLLPPLNTGTLFALRGQHALIFFYRNTHSIYYIYNYVPQTFVPPVGARPPHLYGREELCQPDTREPYARGFQPEDKAYAEGPRSSQCGRKPESRLHQRRGGDAVMRTVTGTAPWDSILT